MGRKIPAGSAVMAPTWYIHHDPEVWPDPWKFDPERFSPENRFDNFRYFLLLRPVPVRYLKQHWVRCYL